MGFFDKIKAGLTKTREALSGTLGSVFSGFSEIDDDFYDELEESLILADLGVDTSVKAVGRLRKAVREQHLKTTEEAREALKEILVDMLSVGDTELNLSTHPSVILVIGVNGVGKTTTIGKIAKQLTSQGKKVMLVAGDTFRAAAADQLEIWAGRSGASIVRQHEGADPASVVFDGIQSAKAQGADLLIAADCTAYAYGRFHQDFIRDRIVLIGCPKLDDTDYSLKLTDILAKNEIRSVTVVRMEVPCCGGISYAAEKAVARCGKKLPMQIITIGTDGEICR